MDPTIFLNLFNQLMVTPCIDLFASKRHFQLRRYFTSGQAGSFSVGVQCILLCMESGGLSVCKPSVEHHRGGVGEDSAGWFKSDVGDTPLGARAVVFFVARNDSAECRVEG